MPRKLIPLTAEISNSESLFDLTSWQKNENFPVPSSGEKCEEKPLGIKVKSLVTKWNGTKKVSRKVDDEKFQIFSTASNSPGTLATKNLNKKKENEDEKLGNKGQSSFTVEKARKTFHGQKKIAAEREKKALAICQGLKGPKSNKSQNTADYSADKDLSLESLRVAADKMKPRDASRSVSFLLPNAPTAKLLNATRPKTGVVINEQTMPRDDCEELNFDPREKQREIEGTRVKVYQCGDKLYARIDGSDDCGGSKNVNGQNPLTIERRTCHRTINIKNSKTDIMMPRRKQHSDMDMTLGQPYGIQLGSFNIQSGYFPVEVRDKQALDVLLAAHGMTYIKHPVNWTQRDIDDILNLGTELYTQTKDVSIDPLTQFTKGFTYKTNFIQVTMSEPIVVGKVTTLTERSIDLKMGLETYFKHHKVGILQTPHIDLYIIKRQVLFVFDPRGRNLDCKRVEKGEAAVMTFARLDNVYHLITSLSKIDTKGPFKISKVILTRMAKSEHATEKFSAVMGNPNRKCRSNDFAMIEDEIACIRGSAHFGSKVFGNCINKQSLTASIMAMVYAKIDPPNSWSSEIVDKVLHFGTKLYSDCIEGGPQRNVTLLDIPSKFYVGEAYRAQIVIAPFVKTLRIEPTRLFCDNPITKALRELIESTTFHCFLLQIDNYSYAVWRMTSGEVFYLFDGHQKNVDGNLDRFEGSSHLFMVGSMDKLCELLVKRFLMTPRSPKSTLNIHGMKITDLKKLNKKEQQSKPQFRIAKRDCIRPLTADDVELIQDSPSTVDSVALLLTADQKLKMREKLPEKPQYRMITDLNSPSLVCTKDRNYDEIMSSPKDKLSMLQKNEFSRETVEVARGIHSDILQNVNRQTERKLTRSKESLAKRSAQKESEKCREENPRDGKLSCGKYVACAEKVLLQSDLACLENQRDDIINMRNLSRVSCQLQEDPPLENEEISSFLKLPDGSEIVRGTKKMFELPLEPKIFDFENFSVLVGVSAIVTSTKYCIGSWTPETVDYVIGIGHILSGAIELKHRTDFYTSEVIQLPSIHIRNKFYSLKMESFENGLWCMLERHLSKHFKTMDRFMIITPNGSLAVFKRKSFYYLFEYGTCNMVGFRIKNDDFGASCFLRFIDVHSMVRRIYSNHSDIQGDQKFLVSQIVVERVKEKDSDKLDYVPFTRSQEQTVIEELRNNRMMRKDQMIAKLKKIDDKIKDEKERLRRYRNLTGQIDDEDVADGDLDLEKIDSNKRGIFDEDDFELDERVSNIEALTVSQPFHVKYKRPKTTVGYHVGDDRIGRIEGSFGLSNRMNVSDDLKACHFVGIFAIMQAVHHPFESMNMRNVDIILENGIKLFDDADNSVEYLKTGSLKGVVVDTTCYELLIKKFTSRNNFINKKKPSHDPEKILKEFFSRQKYALLQAKNCNMVLVNDAKCFHLFDPYNQFDSPDSNNVIDGPKASWIRFDALNGALNYLKERMVPSDDKAKTLFTIHFVSVLCYKTVKAMKAGYFLFYSPESRNDENQKSCQFSNVVEDESIDWICKTRSIPWSRLETRNIMGNERYLSTTKWKEFDIEIDNKLFSLWGNIHPNMKIFKENAGKQHLACAVLSLVMSHMYNIDEWDATLLDSIVAHGHKYFVESIEKVTTKNYDLRIEDLNRVCTVNDFKFNIGIQPVIYGKLYESNRKKFNLRRALDYVFRSKNLPGVIMQCGVKFLAIGNIDNQDYFMLDSQSHGPPVFSCNQGTSYVLKCCCMKILLVCIVLTLNVQCHSVPFYLYAVNTHYVDGIDQDEKLDEEVEAQREDVDINSIVNASLLEIIDEVTSQDAGQNAVDDDFSEADALNLSQDIIQSASGDLSEVNEVPSQTVSAVSRDVDLNKPPSQVDVVTKKTRKTGKKKAATTANDADTVSGTPSKVSSKTKNVAFSDTQQSFPSLTNTSQVPTLTSLQPSISYANVLRGTPDNRVPTQNDDDDDDEEQQNVGSHPTTPSTTQP